MFICIGRMPASEYALAYEIAHGSSVEACLRKDVVCFIFIGRMPASSQAAACELGMARALKSKTKMAGIFPPLYSKMYYFQ